MKGPAPPNPLTSFPKRSTPLWGKGRDSDENKAMPCVLLGFVLVIIFYSLKDHMKRARHICLSKWPGAQGRLSRSPDLSLDQRFSSGVPQTKIFKKILFIALADIVQWIERGPANQSIAGSIPSQSTCLGCRPGPHCGAHKRQTTH